MSLKNPILRVGIIGCGEVAQVAHIPNFNLLSHLYQTTYLCDVSKDALEHSANMVQGGRPNTTTNAEELCSSDDVDVVLICHADEYHVIHGILSLKYDKWVLIEKPLALCFRDISELISAEKTSKGKVFVGTMRRFAPAFLEAVQEVGGMEKILYARVRAIIGPNSNFVGQSGTYPKKFTDYRSEDIKDRLSRNADIVECALRDEFGVAITEDSIRMLHILGRLVVHSNHVLQQQCLNKPEI
jgi:predicted dehydrogenase